MKSYKNKTLQIFLIITLLSGGISELFAGANHAQTGYASSNCFDDKCKTKELHLPATFIKEQKVALTEDITTTIGVWMFDKNRQVAHWLGRVNENNQSILEPINVIWIDKIATNEAEAKINILNFMLDNNFFIEPYSFKLHSFGYQGFYGKNEYKKQFPNDSVWVNMPIPLPNTHLRAFPAKEVKTKNKKVVFITLASISKEKSALQLNCRHGYDSFYKAREILKTNEVFSKSFIKRLNNIYPDSLRLDYTTSDHNGTKIFITRDKKGEVE